VIVFQGIMVVKEHSIFFFHIPNDAFSSLSELRERLDDFSFNVMFDEMNISEKVRDPF